jgi:steroid Delta-isomerase
MNAVVEDPVGSPPIQGTQAIAASYLQSVAAFSAIKMKAEEIIVCGDEAATKWKAHLTTTTGKKFKVGGIGIYKFNQAGKLTLVREFFDVEDFLAQLQN